MMRVFDGLSGAWITPLVLPQKWYPVRSRNIVDFPSLERRKAATPIHLPLEKFQAMNKPFCWTIAVGKLEGSESGRVAKRYLLMKGVHIWAVVDCRAISRTGKR